MEYTWTILKVLAGIFVLSQFVLPFFMLRKMKRKHAQFPSMTSDELRTLASQQPLLYCNKVLEELCSRDEDVTFSLPVLFRMASKRDTGSSLVGWAGLKRHFSETLPDLDFSKNKPTSEERKWMKSKLENYNPS